MASRVCVPFLGRCACLMGQGPVGFYGKGQIRASAHEHFCPIGGFGHSVIGMIQLHIPITAAAARLYKSCKSFYNLL